MGNIQPTGTSSKSTPPNTPRRTSVPNFQEVAFGNTVQPMEGHAQGALSLTITPLPSNATVSVLTPQQISALGPPVRPRPQIVLGELGCPLTLTGESATLTANVTGLEPGTSLAGVFCSILSLALADERGLVNDPSP